MSLQLMLVSGMPPSCICTLWCRSKFSSTGARRIMGKLFQRGPVQPRSPADLQRHVKSGTVPMPELETNTILQLAVEE